MSAVVNTILARCMVEPEFLAALMADREQALRPYDLDERTRADFAALDLRRVSGLASVVTKVQSNGLWQWFPCTRSLLARYGIEHELFAAFGRDHQELRSRPKTRDEQTARFIAFLRDALRDWIPDDLPALRDVFQHEALLWEIRTAMTRPSTEAILHVAHFDSAPADAVAAIQEGRFDPAAVAAAPHWLVYSGDRSSSTIRIVETDERTARVLTHAGAPSIAAIARRSGQTPATVRRVLALAADAGLLASQERHAHRPRRQPAR